MTGLRAVALAAAASLAAASLAAPSLVHAQASATQDAARRFQHGVTLYNEADYRAALVEFRRAYEIAPNAAVLYNIGQSYYQLQDYAAALTTFERYLNDAGPAAPHRRDVEQTIDTLQSRVGKVAVTTAAPGCDVAIDDEPAGRTPNEPVRVSIGRRKVSATCPGRAPEVRVVDVAAGDTVAVAITETTARPPIGPPADSLEDRGPPIRGYYATGVLGAATVVAGVAAYLASRDLKQTRDRFGATHDDLDKKSTRVTVLAVATDVLAVATLVTGGITLKIALSRSESHEAHLAISPMGVQFAGTFR